ncbi:MAG TPA: LptF/LptG family permease [Paludibacteraceae bacterium]|nr:LptF/LptG family permease [Paludibacteraceae bacterium]HQB68933.1 LptF/LptG family permease [Paludibacteraceae bacterium]HRS67243.1 LptF/LptG family permease [Paludibacteraceae bacterium]
MFRIKRIDSYLFAHFIQLFFATFFICLFIVVMQFLWLHVDDLVGKGLPIDVLLEFFFYAALSSVPLALPLAILLASIMTFGNIGESLELLAMKSAGISLFRIMRSLIFFIALVSVGAFFFSNNVIPFAQKRMWTLMFSIRQKSPELEIPVGEFYSGIKGMNIYVRERDKKTGALKNIMIYDFTNGFDNASVTTADSAFIKLTADKMNLQLTMYRGEAFENLKRQEAAGLSGNVPYRRETFAKKEILLDFDANFSRMDESLMEDQHISKNIVKLTQDVDSSNLLRDSLRTQFSEEMTTKKYFGRVYDERPSDELAERSDVPLRLDADSLFLTLPQPVMVRTMNQAVSRAQMVLNDVQYNRAVIGEVDDYFTRHNIEWHRKFTLSFACLIFFFIGAPLGAIVRKGGLGISVVVSVVFFIIYYIIDTTGQKMAREGLWYVWQGMWLSSAVLLPIGIFLTYKAATDSALFDLDSYKLFWERVKLLFRRGR